MENKHINRKIGYLVPEFPGQTHAFFWREISEIEKLDENLELISTKRPKKIGSHNFVEKAKNRTYYISDVTIFDIFRFLFLDLLRLPVIFSSLMDFFRDKKVSLFRKMAIFLLASKLKFYCRKHSIEHIHCHSCADSAYILVVSKLIGGPTYSLTLHGDLEVYGGGHELKFSHAQFATCVTQNLIETVNRLIGPTVTHLAHVRMGINYEEFSDILPDYANKGPYKILSVGRLNKQKGHKIGINAINLLKQYDVHYTIIGEGEYRSALEDLISEKNLGNYVSLAGEIPNEKIKMLLQGCDIFILPSIGMGEAAPVAVMEAMAAGVPVISSIIGGTPEMITDNIDGMLIPQNDIVKLTGKIEKLIKNNDLREAIGKAAKYRAKKDFSSKASAQKLLELIRDL